MAVPVRYRLIGVLTAGAMINFIDRVNISVAAPAMMPALGLNKAEFGVVMSAFLAGYTLFQFPGGLMADRWNTKRIIALSCLGFSVFTALTPLGGLAFGLMVAIRFMVGAFESVSFPAYASMNSRWIPRQEYSRAQTVSLSGSYLGQTIGYPLTTWIVAAFSWPMVFYFNAVLGILWMGVWLWFSTNTPREHPRISESELKYIEDNRASRPGVTVSPWAILKSPTVLMLSASYMFLVYGVWMIVLWLPTYLVEGRGFSMQAMGWVGMIPTVASFVGLIGGGVLSDTLLRRGFSRRFARAQGPALCIGAGVPFLVGAMYSPSAGVSVACFAIYLFSINLATGGYWSVPLELNPKLVGAISGVMTFAGNLGGFFGPLSAGYIYQATGNWSLPFLTAAGGAIISFLIFYFLVRPEPMEFEQATGNATAAESAVGEA
ncbi:MAG: MFS transporter [Acidobacteria bacterium]|nr:MFS transporter [Acidobacteriota bacterium]MCW5970041.1 MFS transporter [Blastocatellales bacterium]